MCQVVIRFFRSLSALMFGFCFSQELVCCLVFEPFKTRPVYELLLVSSFFLCQFDISVATFFFFFLSLSGAGETQTPFRGFGVPLVFLRPGRALRLRSVRLPLHLQQGRAQPQFFCFFLFSPAPLVFPVRVFLGLSRMRWVSGRLFLCWWVSACTCRRY